MYGELYLHGQREKTVVELLKVKMPGLIRLNTAATFRFCFAHWCEAGTVLETPPDLTSLMAHFIFYMKVKK